MNIATEITRLQKAKINIKTAIESKGVTVGDGLIDTYADKIAEISSGGADSAYQNGFEDGKKAEHYRFWNVLQKGGEEELSYYWTFSNGRYTDENYGPIFPIRCSSGLGTGGQNIFYGSSITDTKVEIITGINRSITNCFSGCTEMHTIRKIITNPGTTYKDAFKGCESLVNIEMAGTCGKDISFPDSPLLSKESIISIKNVLSDETDSLTVTFNKTAINNAFGIDIDDESTYTDEWNTLRESKSNWTFSFV